MLEFINTFENFDLWTVINTLQQLIVSNIIHDSVQIGRPLSWTKVNRWPSWPASMPTGWAR